MPVYAHSPRDDPSGRWEPLADHLLAVGTTAKAFAEPFGWAGIAELLGRLHDIGKCSAEFQAYICNKGASGGDHSGAGAVEVQKLPHLKPLYRALAAIIAGHHAGLADAADLAERLARGVPAYTGWEAHAGALPGRAALAPTKPFGKSPEGGFHLAFLARMLFSCLVDADAIETARFYREAERTPFLPIPELRDRLDAHIDALAAEAAPTALNALRADVLAHVRGRAELPPGLFTLTVPTGGGKTLTSLSFALRHAARHGLRRVVTVIPFAGARIETCSSPSSARPGPTLPRGSADRNPKASRLSSSAADAPSRERGSKQHRPVLRGASPSTLPRGSADRNTELRDNRGTMVLTLPRGSADRNHLRGFRPGKPAQTLPRGSADRNETTSVLKGGVLRRSLAGARIETRPRAC